MQPTRFITYNWWQNYKWSPKQFPIDLPLSFSTLQFPTSPTTSNSPCTSINRIQLDHWPPSSPKLSIFQKKKSLYNLCQEIEFIRLKFSALPMGENLPKIYFALCPKHLRAKERKPVKLVDPSQIAYSKKRDRRGERGLDKEDSRVRPKLHKGLLSVTVRT